LVGIVDDDDSGRKKTVSRIAINCRFSRRLFYERLAQPFLALDSQLAVRVQQTNGTGVQLELPPKQINNGVKNKLEVKKRRNKPPNFTEDGDLLFSLFQPSGNGIDFLNDFSFPLSKKCLSAIRPTTPYKTITVTL